MIHYSILDPTGNITALVESAVPVGRQPEIASELMRRHPEVEQVGFIRFIGSPDAPVQAELRMAGGEFCGNASVCAASLYLLEIDPDHRMPFANVRLSVSGASRPVDVALRREGENAFCAVIDHPGAEEITETDFVFHDLSDQLPLVRMEGISHIIIGPDSPFFSLQENRSAVEEALRTRCALLSADGLGLIFLEPEGPDYRLTPFVYIPGSGTFFRENSCASGSAAAAMVLAARSGAPVSLTLHEPGGILRAESDPLSGKTQLTIRTRLLSRMGPAEDHSRIPVR